MVLQCRLTQLLVLLIRGLEALPVSIMQKLNKVSSLVVRPYNLDGLILGNCVYNHLSRAGLPNGGSPVDGVLLSERRIGRKTKRQKNSTKLIDGKYQAVSSGKENVEVGISHIEDRVKEQVKIHGSGGKFLEVFAPQTIVMFILFLLFKYSMSLFTILLHFVKDI